MNEVGVQSRLPFIQGLLASPSNRPIRQQAQLSSYTDKFGLRDPRKQNLMMGMPQAMWNASMMPGGGVSAFNPTALLYGINPTILRSTPPGGPISNGPFG